MESITKCVCGKYHCPICDNQMELFDDDTYKMYYKSEIERLEKENIELQEIYCSECGACGEPGCCPPERCKELKSNLKCLYGIEYAKEYKELLDENYELRKKNEELEDFYQYLLL